MQILNIKKSEKLYAKALQIIPGASQTGSKRPERFAPGVFPMYIEKAKGSHVWDADGNEYIDYIMALGPISLGYCYPAIDNAIKEQLKKGIIFSLMHSLEIQAAEAVIATVPSAEMVRFFKTGAEATAAAVRIARAYTGKEKILSYGYHGWHDMWTANLIPSPISKGVPRTLKKYISEFAYNDSNSHKSINKLLEKNKDDVACILMTPVSYWNSSGKKYLQWVRKLANKYKVVLIFDEIVTGFRLALGGAQEYFNVIPDITCLAKGIASGPPISAVAGRKKFMKIMDNLAVSTTYGGETLSLASIVAAIKEYKKKKVPEHLWMQGKKLMDSLNLFSRKINLPAEWKGFAPIGMFRFMEKPELAEQMMTLFLQECAKRGVLFRRGGPIYICYSHTDKDIKETIEVCKEVLNVIKCGYDKGNIPYLLETTEPAKLGFRRFR